jgi:hypothetical protein
MTATRMATVREFLAYIKRGPAHEIYVFIFDAAHRLEVQRTLGRFASNPELSFSWYDAAVVSQKVSAKGIAK